MKKRADLLVFEQGLSATRTEAQALILAGQVFSSKGRVEKAGQLFSDEEVLTVKEKLPYVSRGGVKLAHALEVFDVKPKSLICLDVGASTGGFTDCLLQNQASRVYAVDVGYGQFHAKLRQDPRVVLIERMNFRHMEETFIPEKVDLVVIDVSFISLSKILPKVKEFLKQGGRVIALVKPQFELTPKDVKKGIVRSEELREKAVARISTCAHELGFKVLGKTDSPILGAKGNREHFLFASL